MYSHSPIHTLQPGRLFWAPDSYNQLPTWPCHQHVQRLPKLNVSKTALPIIPPKLLISVNGNSTVLFSGAKKPWSFLTPLSHSTHNSGVNRYLYTQEIQNSTTSHFLQHCCPSPSSVPFFFFLPHPTACRLLVPSPGTKLKPPAVEAQSLNRWTTKEVSVVYKILYIRSHHSSVHTFQSFVSHTD